MNWEHKCSLDWLMERQSYLTASEIAKLLPTTKTGRPRTVSDVDRIKVAAGKMVDLTEDDCMSYGVMARGHIMEPHAIEALNDMLARTQGSGVETFHWWDDELVTVPGRQIAFSPDAMDIDMFDVMTMADVKHAHAIAEVKSYAPDRHLATAYTPKEELEERWQIATAFALLDNLDHAYLVLFNPKMTHRKVFVIRYDRKDLQSEVKAILKVEADWADFLEHGPLNHKPASGAIWSDIDLREEDVMAEAMKADGLNPV